MRAFPIVCLLVAACSGARPIPPVDRTDSCASVVQRLERSSPLSEVQKQAAFDELKGRTVEWSLRVLAVSQFADPLDGPRTFSVDVECDNAPRVSGQAMRYLMTLVVSDPHAAGFEKLRRGAVVPVRATLRRYEGHSAFSAKGFLLREGDGVPEVPSASVATEEAKGEEARKPEAAPLDAPPASEVPKARETDRTKAKASPRAKSRGR